MKTGDKEVDGVGMGEKCRSDVLFATRKREEQGLRGRNPHGLGTGDRMMITKYRCNQEVFRNY